MNIGMVKFRDLPVGRWFEYDYHLYQKMRVLNTANAYCFTEGNFAWIKGDAEVKEVSGPKHMDYEVNVHRARLLLEEALKVLTKTEGQ